MLTGSSAVVMLSITGLFNTPIQLQQFSVDDIFDSEVVKTIETMMGVDGVLSAGYVNVERKQTFNLQGDSPSNDLFDQWDAAQRATNDVFVANGTVFLTTLGKKWTMTRGFLTGYTPIPSVKKLVQPRKYEITWNTLAPSPS